MSPWQGVIGCLLLAWQTAAAAWDFIDRRIPVWFSLVPLVAGLVYFGGMVSPAGAALLLVSILATNLPSWVGVGLTAVPALCLAIFTYPQPEAALYAGWVLFWLMWLSGVLGGADALAGTALLVWFPSPTMLAAVLAGLLLWSLGRLARCYGLLTPLRIWVVLRQGLPGRGQARDRQPGLGAFPVALALFMLWQALH